MNEASSNPSPAVARWAPEPLGGSEKMLPDLRLLNLRAVKTLLFEVPIKISDDA
jgi:hypothetical protein